MRQPIRRSNGFTIIELLVVISIIALLISILLPSLANARDRARYIKWAGYSHGLRPETSMLAYYNFEQQDGTQVDSTGVPVVWNRAEGDPLLKAKIAIEPETYNLRYGGYDDVVGLPTDPNHYPEWVTTTGDGRARWRGKGGTYFDPVGGLLPTLGTELFNGEESRTEDNIIHNVTFSFWTNITGFANWTQRIHFWEDINGEAGTYLFHTSTGNHAVFRSQNAGTQLPVSGVLKEDRWHHIVCTFEFNEGGNGTKTIYLDGKQIGQASNDTGPTQPITGLTLGRANQTWLGVLDELQIWHKPIDAKTVKEQHKVGKPRRKQ